MSSWNQDGLEEELGGMFEVDSTDEGNWDVDLNDVIAAVGRIETSGTVDEHQGDNRFRPVPEFSADVDYREVSQQPSLPELIPAGVPCGHDPPVPPIPLERFITLQHPHRILRTEGFLWMVGEFFWIQGHPGLTMDAVGRMYRWLPPLSPVHDPIPVLLSAFHTLATYRTAETIFRGWADRAGRLIITDQGRRNRRGPILMPWAAPAYWTLGTWELCVLVLRRFLRQSHLEDQTRFVDGLDDVRDAAGVYQWTIDYVTSVYYFVEANTHLWDVIFCQQE